MAWYPLFIRTPSGEQRERFLPLCPDFVIALRSPSDNLATIGAKMEEYWANGARLGWLIDVPTRRVLVYRPGAPIDVVAGPTRLDATPELPGFALDLAPIWSPPF